jgi:S1-C subfamily serine protease
MEKTIRQILGVAVSLVLLSGLPVRAQVVNAGTAFTVTEDGDLITNEHVISGCTTVETLLGARRFIGAVTVRDPDNDLAIVRLNERIKNVAILRKSPPLRAGEQAITYGFPLPDALATEGNLTIGYISALRGLADNPNYIQIRAERAPDENIRQRYLALAEQWRLLARQI